ncbi:MAG: hypothetical protein CW338_06710 [Clostridiales bacterium]|nr:hypothetical protein [Clostridiales bacterium]
MIYDRQRRDMTEQEMTIRTERLTLRPVRPTDAPAMERVWSDFNASPYACYDTPHSAEPEDVLRQVTRWAQFTAAGEDHLFFAVCPRDELIGFFAFNRRCRGYEISYAFRAGFQGMGYAREALTALTAFFRRRGCPVLYAGTGLKNAPSVRLLEAAGFILTETERVIFYKDENGSDIVFDGGVFELEL